MSVSAEKFKGFRQELYRLHEPVTKHNERLLTPVDVKVSVRPEPPREASGLPVAPPRVTVEPRTLECRLPLFKDISFEINATGDESVQVVWRSPGESAWQCVVMDRESGDAFTATLYLDDGDYFYGFKSGGVTTPDPARAHRLLLCPDGVFNILCLSRYSRTLTLHNRGEGDEVV